MFEKTPVQEKSFKGFLKRLALRLKEHPRMFAFIRFFIVALRKFRRKLNRLVGGFAVRYRISGRRERKEKATIFSKNVKFSIVVPLYNTPVKFLREMIKSVQNQTYANWQLCLADGSDNEHNYVGEYVRNVADDRICYKKLEKNMGIADNTNACIEMASGDFIALFDHDDLLHPSALFEMARVVEDGADFIYTDEVTFVGRTSNITIYNFKPDYSPDTLRSYNYICHFTAFSKELLNTVGGFNREYDGSQDYDLILRLTEKAKNIVHIPKALYFWRSHKASVASDVSAKPYVVESAKRALASHIERLGLSGRVEDATVPTTYKIQYDIIGEPLVSIIIPNKDHTDDLKKCLTSVYQKSTYKNFEVIVVENNSTEPETFKYYKAAQSKYDNLRVITWERGFNYSAINNFAAKQVDGEYILLLNNDIEVITPDWIEQMLMFAQRKDVGAVGAKLYYDDDTIQHAGVIVGLGGVAGHSHKGFARDNPGYMARASIAQNLSACTAACLLIRKDVYDRVEGLDEGYAVAFNDIDLCMKIRASGYLIVFTPFAEFYHYESKSRGDEDTPEKRARFNSEVFRFQERWKKQLKSGDPYYNLNLSLDTEDFALK
ncbi:MAG: glycosyltransferase family 2 protein [Clostridia bacterium]|nr:glycosyltransferase family 2 protein [Clostridia bacterium]